MNPQEMSAFLERVAGAAMDPTKLTKVLATPNSPASGTVFLPALYRACRGGALPCVHLLAPRCPDAAQPLPTAPHSTALHAAAYGGHLAVVCALLTSYGGAAALGAKNDYGEAPLDNARTPADGVSDVVKAQVVAQLTAAAGGGDDDDDEEEEEEDEQEYDEDDGDDDTGGVSAKGGEDLSHLNTAALKVRLSKYGAALSGSKPVLVQRLAQLLAAQNGAPPLKKAKPETAKKAANESPDTAAGLGAAAVHAAALAKKEAELAALTIADLKVKLSQRGGMVSGTKPVLIKRLAALECAAGSVTTSAPLQPASVTTPLPIAGGFDLRAATGAEDAELRELWATKFDPAYFGWCDGVKWDWQITNIRIPTNPSLAAGYAAWREERGAAAGVEEVGFVGVFRHLSPDDVCRHGVMRAGDNRNPNGRLKNGHQYMGDPAQGVYVCRWSDAAFQHACTSEKMGPIKANRRATLVVLKVSPGRTVTPEGIGKLPPTPGFDSHVAPSQTDWFLFDTRQALPVAVIDVVNAKPKA